MEPGTVVNFSALPAPGKRVKYTWSFGDGVIGHGVNVKHKYADAEGSDLDGIGLNGTGAGTIPGAVARRGQRRARGLGGSKGLPL